MTNLRELIFEDDIEEIGSYNIGYIDFDGEEHETQGDVHYYTTYEDFIEWAEGDLEEANSSIDRCTYVEYAGNEELLTQTDEFDDLLRDYREQRDYIIEKKNRMQNEFMKLIDKYTIDANNKINLTGTLDKEMVLKDLSDLYWKMFIRK